MYWLYFIKHVALIFTRTPFPLTLWTRLHIAVTYIGIKCKEIILVKLFHIPIRNERTIYPEMTFRFYAYTQFVSLFEDIFIQHHYYHPILHNKNITVVDGGAHMGMFTAYCNWINDSVRVIAYEADPTTFGLLQYNVQTNNWKKTKCINAALAGKKGKAWFYYDEEFPASFVSSLTPERGFGGKVKVNCAPLSTILGSLSIDYVKLDIEGAEYVVLDELSKKKLLSKTSVYAIEFHHNIPGKTEYMSSILRKLAQGGFTYSISAQRPSEQLGYQDVFVSAVKRFKTPKVKMVSSVLRA